MKDTIFNKQVFDSTNKALATMLAHVEESCQEYDREDNWSQFEYASIRYLDALARVFHIEVGAAAAIASPLQKQFSIAFNKTLSNDKKLLFNELGTLLKKFVASNTSDTEQQSYNSLANFLLQNNKCYNPMLTSKVIKKVAGIVPELETLHQDIKLKKNINYTPSHIQELINKTLLKSEYIDVKMILNSLWRPIQDIYKLKYILNKNSSTDYDFILIDNKEKLHAETCIANKHHESLKGYIGISKLSCVLCEMVLSSNENPNHRGKHGTLFVGTGNNGWNVTDNFNGEVLQKLIQFLGQKISTIPKKLSLPDLAIQYSDLSDDEEIDQKVIVSPDLSLSQLKKQSMMIFIKQLIESSNESLKLKDAWQQVKGLNEQMAVVEKQQVDKRDQQIEELEIEKTLIYKEQIVPLTKQINKIRDKLIYDYLYANSSDQSKNCNDLLHNFDYGNLQQIDLLGQDHYDSI